MNLHKLSKVLGMLSLSLIAIVPFASRVHFLPLPQWFGEINVIWLLGASVVFLLLTGNMFRAIPKSTYWCLLLAVLWGIQPWLVKTLFPGMTYVTALAWLAMAILAATTYSWQETLGRRQFAVYLAWALIIGGLVQSLIGLAQVLNIADRLGLFYDYSHPTTNIFGHIGQRNQYAHYLMWSVVAGVYLYAIGKLNRLWLTVLVLWLSVMLAWAGSRTILLYLVGLAGLSVIWHWRIKSAESRRLLLAMWCACFSILVLQFAIPLINHLLSMLTHSAMSNASGVERLAANGDDMGSRRFAEMHKAWLAFLSHPLWGVGWSQYAAESVRMQPWPQFAQAGFNSGLFTNAHNLIAQLLAEMGLPITLCVVLGMVWCIWSFFSMPAELEGVLALGCIAITLTHSMLEYPLWYLYFLAMLIIFIAMAPTPRYKALPVMRYLLLPLTGWVMWLSIVSASVFWSLVNLSVPTENAAADVKREASLIKIAKDHPLFEYHAFFSIDDYIHPTKDNLNEKIEFESRLAAFRPYPDVMLKKAQLLALQGHQQEAVDTLRTSLASFPTYASQFLTDLGNKEPAWAPLRQVTQDVYNSLPAKYRNAE